MNYAPIIYLRSTLVDVEVETEDNNEMYPEEIKGCTCGMS
jgi:hypothetical protein